MFASRWTLSACLLTCFLACAAVEDPGEIKAKPGEDVLLQCWGIKHGAIKLLEWSRTDLGAEYAFYFRDNHTHEDFQHESFQGRVQLRDPQMNDRDFSVILKNVNIKDTGTYECRVLISDTLSLKTDTLELTSRVHLTVTDSGHNKSGGNKAANVGLAVRLSLVTCFFFFLVL